MRRNRTVHISDATKEKVSKKYVIEKILAKKKIKNRIYYDVK